MEKRKLQDQTSEQQKKKRKIQSSKQVYPTLLRFKFPLLHRKKKKSIKAVAPSTVDLPHEVIIEILSRLPPKDLIKFSTVSKPWSATIFSEYFASIHFLNHSQNSSKLLFKFYKAHSFKCPFFLDVDAVNQFFSIDTAEKDVRNNNYAFQKLGTIKSGCKRKLIGFCCGLVCLYRVKDELIEVCNPSRREILVIYAPRPTKRIKGYGFGYDSVSNQYKIVFVFDGFVCKVFTLGSNSWREVSISNTDAELAQLVAFECSSKANKSAVFCNGAFYWKKLNTSPTELVMYDLHEEKFQIIQLPDECPKQYHLFAHQGSLCAARLEKFRKRKCKVQLEWLTKVRYDNGEDEMVWRPETLVLPFLPPLKDLKRREAVRIVTIHDQILLHWLDDWGRIVLYDIHRRTWRAIKRPDGVRKTHYCLTDHLENFRSFKTFLQEGVHKVLSSYPSKTDIKTLIKKKRRKSDIAFLFSSSQDENQDQEVPRTEFYL